MKTDPVIFYLLQNDHVRLEQYLAERHNTQRVLKLVNSEISHSLLKRYELDGGVSAPELQVIPEHAEEGIYWHDAPHKAEYYLHWDDLKSHFKDGKNEYFPELKGKIAFSCSNALQGKIITPLFRKQKVVLASYGVTNKNGDWYDEMYFFDEKPPKKFKKKTSLDFVFDIYAFECTNGRKVLVLSQEELPPEEIIIEGNIIELEDLTLVGSKKELSTKLPVFLYCRHRHNIKPFADEDELLLTLKKHEILDDGWFDYLFRKQDGFTYRSTLPFNEYEWILSSVVLSSKVDDYPLHLMIIGHPGSGKTTAIEAIQGKLEPDHNLVEGSGSTIKALIPSFAGEIPDNGAMLKATRLIGIDEFFRLLLRSNSEHRHELLGLMNSLLEHKKRNYGSGKGHVEGKMTARMIATSNPIDKNDTFQDLVNKIDNSFLSRLLIVWQTRKESERMRECQKKKKCKKTPDEILVRVHDYFQTRFVEGNPELLKLIFKKHKEIMSASNLDDIYSARYGKHHIQALFDGIVKTRYLVKGGKLEPTREDYRILENIWDFIIRGWEVRYSDAFSGYDSVPKLIGDDTII